MAQLSSVALAQQLMMKPSVGVSLGHLKVGVPARPPELRASRRRRPHDGRILLEPALQSNHLLRPCFPN